MNRRFGLTAMILVSLLTSCASLSKNEDGSAEMEEVVFDDGYKIAAQSEINTGEREAIEKGNGAWTPEANSQEIIKIASDNSKITTTFDRYGNKTETRHFNNHTRLSFILLRTTAEGEKQVFVYGQNGDVKSLPETMLDKVTTASADELANSAGIVNQQRQTSTSVQNTSSPNSAPLRPLPSYNFPVQAQPAQPVEKAEKNAETGSSEPQNKETTAEENNDPLP